MRPARERESTCHGASSPPRRQHRGFTGSSRREEAPKKPSAIGPARRQSPLTPKASGVSAGEPQPRARRRAPASSIAAAASTTAPHPHRRARQASSSTRVAPHNAPLAPHASRHPPKAAGERVTCARFRMPAKRKQPSVTARFAMLLTSHPRQVAWRLFASESDMRFHPPKCARPR